MKKSAIIEDVFPRVPFHKAKIEDFFGFDGAYATGPCTEAVNEPRELAERSELEDLQAAGLAQIPWESDTRAVRGRRRRLTRATPLQ